MHPCLAKLPDVLLFNLGRCSQQHYLRHSFSRASMDASKLFQLKDGKAYHVGVGASGLVVTLQCTNPEAESEERLWGLHGFTLHTALSHQSDFWRGPWPEGIDAVGATANDVARVFSVDDSDVLHNPFMLSLLVPGADGQTWTVLCAFDMNTQRLCTMSFVRTDDWLTVSTLPAWQVEASTVGST